MKEQIKKLRKGMNLTQQEFADKIGISRNNIAGYESGGRQPSDAVISLICREFHVNETWLRDGTGEMFLPQNGDLVLDDSTLDDIDRAMLRTYINAPRNVRQLIRQMVLDAADSMRKAAKEPAALTIDEKVAAYRAELEAEEKAKAKLSALHGTGEESA